MPSVEIDPAYMEEARRASQGNREGLPSEAKGGGRESPEAPKKTLEEIEAKMAKMRNRPLDISFEPTAHLFVKVQDLKQKISELEHYRDNVIKGPRSLTVMMEPGSKEDPQKKLHAELVEPVNKEIQDLQIEIALMEDAAEELGKKGESDWANKYFGKQEVQAAQELQAAAAEEAAREKAGLGDLGDLDEAERRIKEIKKAKSLADKCRKAMERATSQRMYLELMKKRAQLLKKRPRA
jgi:hypothetical protein